ncbi:MAG: hypothetical protein Q4F01_01705 [Staphylococcus rostri]|uniref:hypothetical protein n=1 Tax=Staphylococcus rostri TaxID=522262 RepID=UPI0026DFED3F|nr:hypothetical protein [Staphylococcus rostri]MDO5374900.1 hypothetical protein [Staphylococcus rostri]
MGLSYAPDYTWTEHFVKRASERFGVDSTKIAKWVAHQSGSLTPYSEEVETPKPEIKKYVSDDGVVFVCNTVEFRFVTCYEANDLLKEGGKTTIHENNVDLFKKDANKLARRYRVKDSQEMLQSVAEHIEAFYELSHKLMNGRLSEQNYKHLESLIDEYHAVKAAMRVIENKQNDFKFF